MKAPGQIAVAVLVACFPASAAHWKRAGLNTDNPLWGLEGGLQFSLHPASFSGHGDGGPRGLIRLGYPTLSNGGCALINFIAVEPVVKGRKGFSELERSVLDNVSGKRFWTGVETNQPKSSMKLEPGTLLQPARSVEQIEVVLRVKKFENGAHVFIAVTQRTDASGEITLTDHAEADSAPLEFCILTATMGNLARARQLWLRDEVVSSRRLYADCQDVKFPPHK